jgi:hypothetical protein
MLCQRVPNLSEAEHKAVDWAFSNDRFGLFDRFMVAIRPKYFYRSTLWVDEPSQLRAVLDPLSHFGSKNWQAVCCGAPFDHKVRAEVPETFQFRLIELSNPNLPSPSGIGRTPRSARQHEAGGRIGDQSFVIHPSPRYKLFQNFRVAYPCERVGRRHNDKFTLRGRLKEEIRMFGAERRELIVVHWGHRESSGQPTFIDY